MSGFYGWGSMLAWNCALFAAAFSALRPNTRPQPDRVSSAVRRCFRIPYNWAWWLRRDLELVFALVVVCVAAGDVYLRSRQLSFHQLFTYSHPSFVPTSESDEAAADILATRAALVFLNQFVLAVAPVAILPIVILPELTGRQIFRSLAIFATLVWSFAATQKLICSGTQFFSDDWYGACGSAYVGLVSLATTGNIVPGGNCGVSIWTNAWFITSLGFITFLLAVNRVNMMKGPSGSVIIWWVVFLLAATLYCVLFLWVCLLSVMSLFLPFIYIVPTSRQCMFGPSSSISFSELDQIFFLVTAAIASACSIWDSIST